MQGTALQCIPSREHEPLGTVLAELPVLVVVEHAKGLGRVIHAHDRLGVEYVAEVLAAHAIEPRVVGVQLGAQQGAAHGIAGDGQAVVA